MVELNVVELNEVAGGLVRNPWPEMWEDFIGRPIRVGIAILF